MVKLFLVSFFVALPLSAPAQQEVEPCKTEVQYASRNQVDPKPLSVTGVLGRVFIEVGELGGATKEVGAVTEACLGLFTEKERHLVATTTVNDRGHFAFGAVPIGKYRLVVHAGPLCVANVPLHVTRSRGKRHRGKQIVVHMRAAGYDTCSYADYQ
jgi:hypothetical protein